MAALESHHKGAQSGSFVADQKIQTEGFAQT
jgi:hypothetical protein